MRGRIAGGFFILKINVTLDSFSSGQLGTVLNGI